METIGVCIPAWGRHSLTERVLDYYRGLRTDFPIEIILGLSEDVPYGVSDLTVVHSPNHPLGSKFNDIVEATKGLRGAMIVGSDDIIHRDYFSWLMENDEEFVELGRCYYFDQESGRMVRHYKGILGAGKWLRRSMLERCGYRPYRDSLTSNVDSGPVRFALSKRLIEQDWAIDIKTPSENMWDFDHIVGRYQNTEEADASPVFRSFGLDVNDWR